MGKVALVTGAGKRIGKAIALALAEAGYDVAVHVNRSLVEGNAVAKEIEAMGRRAGVVQADQRSVESIERACQEASTRLGPVTCLVNSAAVWPQTTLESCTQEDVDLSLEVNLRAPFFWAKFLGLKMKELGGGVIINIADVSVDRPRIDGLPYEMSKAGVVTMTYGLAKALAPTVRVNAISPGPIVFPPGYPEEKKQAERDATLLGREGDEASIAKAVCFLAGHDYITGVVLPVDGGFRFGI
jgi:pteridine reductase